MLNIFNRNYENYFERKAEAFNYFMQRVFNITIKSYIALLTYKKDKK